MGTPDCFLAEKHSLESPNSFSKLHFTADLIQQQCLRIINGVTQACVSQTALYFYIFMGMELFLAEKCACCSACCLVSSTSGWQNNLNRSLSMPSIHVHPTSGFNLLFSPGSSISLTLLSQHFLVPLSASPFSFLSKLPALQYHFKRTHFEHFRGRGTRSSEQGMM